MDSEGSEHAEICGGKTSCLLGCYSGWDARGEILVSAKVTGPWRGEWM